MIRINLSGSPRQKKGKRGGGGGGGGEGGEVSTGPGGLIFLVLGLVLGLGVLDRVRVRVALDHDRTGGAEFAQGLVQFAFGVGLEVRGAGAKEHIAGDLDACDGEIAQLIAREPVRGSSFSCTVRI